MSPGPAGRRKLVQELVRRGLARDEAAALQAIESRTVTVDGSPALNPRSYVGATADVQVHQRRRFVSRGGLKLQGALEDLQVPVDGKRCLDAGAGSGGFTDCLLEAGAVQVVAVDVGYGQFDWRLRNDPRVRLLERTNIKSLSPPQARGPFDLVVADLSFISLVSVAPALAQLTAVEGSLVLMVKPQHEAPRALVGPKGIVSDPAVWTAVMESVVHKMSQLGFGLAGASPSRLRGAEGNQEFFLHFDGRRESDTQAIGRAVRAAGPPGAK